MVLLKGDNLGKRQRELNIKVNEAALKKQDFEEARIQSGDSDVDKLYLIDLASKYKNVNYIIEVLKSGDSLHISRALKCVWLYEDDLSNIINTDYLHHNIFPLMSFKMKSKFLTTISTHVTNEHRASDFYNYCCKIKLYNIALKFLIFTSESVKLEAIESPTLLDKIRDQKDAYIQFLIGNSFVLAKAYLEHIGTQEPSALYKLRYLISVSDIEYLDMLENYEDASRIIRFGLRISKHILKNHKPRVFLNPYLYCNILNKSMFTKHVTVEEAKKCAVDLLPNLEREFWDDNYCSKYEFIIEIIPEDERFKFLKKIFNEKYSNEDFEMTENFFEKECYRFMTLKEKHSWALRHVESKKEIQGVGRDFKWYEFVEFETAFPEIKKYVMITPELSKRSEIINVLILSCRSQREIEKLLTYYYNRHINEVKRRKESFIKELLSHHSIFDFDCDCWMALNKILHNIEIYNDLEDSNEYLTLSALAYHIIRKMDIPDALKHHIDSGISCYYLRRVLKSSNLSEERKEVLFHFFVSFYEEKIKNLDGDDISEDATNKIISYVDCVLQLIKLFKKTSDSCSEIIMKYVNLDPGRYEYHGIFKHSKITESLMLRYLKKDVTVVIDKISDVRNVIVDDSSFRINQLLKKMKIYFPNDVGKEYLDCFVKMLTEKLYERSVFTVVYGIFQLADEQFKADFLMKYVPEEAKVDRKKIDTQLLYIQRGICNSVCFSRPPVQLSHVLMYIKGDYTKYCLPMFNSYLQNLPLPQCFKFAEALIAAPLSIQKHGIRIAYKCFKPENFKALITDVWNKTNNVSLRFIVYEVLYNKILDEDEVTQLDLFELLKSCTLSFNEDDQEKLYSFLTSNKLPSSVLSQYIEVGWQTVEKLSNSTVNLSRKTAVIRNICNKIDILDVEFVQRIVDEHIKNEIINFEIPPDVVSYELYMVKWSLVSTFLVYFASDKKYLERNKEQARYIVKTCIEKWDVVHDETFTYRKFCWRFIDDLASEYQHNGSYEDAIPVVEAVLTILQESLPLRVIYLQLWSLRLSILNRKAKQAGKSQICKEETVEGKIKVLKETIGSFVKVAANLIKESVEKSSYFLTFSDDLKDIIKDNVMNIKTSVDDERLDIASDICIVAADCLTDIRLFETYLIAVQILPEYSECCLSDEYTSECCLNDEYTSVVNKIKSYDNEEIGFCMFQKFNNNFQSNKFL